MSFFSFLSPKNRPRRFWEALSRRTGMTLRRAKLLERGSTARRCGCALAVQVVSPHPPPPSVKDLAGLGALWVAPWDGGLESMEGRCFLILLCSLVAYLEDLKCLILLPSARELEVKLREGRSSS